MNRKCIDSLMTTLDIEQIKALLPHRYPFLLVDKVIDYQENKSIKAIKNVSYNEPFFQGHFAEKSVMPGVLIIEAMAQATGILGSISHNGIPDGSLYYLVGVDKTRFRQTVGPGDQLLIESEILTVKRNIWKFSATATVEGKLIASAELMTTVVDVES